MKISLLQLEKVISKMKYSLVGYSDKKDLELTISFESADPGKGIMVDMMILKAQAPLLEGDEKEISMQVELFEPSEQQDPRASRIESFKIDSKY